MPHNEECRPSDDQSEGTATKLAGRADDASVTDPCAVECARVRWRLDRMRYRRRLALAFDELLGVTRPAAAPIDYRRTGLVLDWPQREAAAPPRYGPELAAENRTRGPSSAKPCGCACRCREVA